MSKPVPATEGIRRAWAPLAAALLAAVLGFWWLQYESAPSATVAQAAALSHDKATDRDDD